VYAVIFPHKRRPNSELIPLAGNTLIDYRTQIFPTAQVAGASVGKPFFIGYSDRNDIVETVESKNAVVLQVKTGWVPTQPVTTGLIGGCQDEARLFNQPVFGRSGGRRWTSP